MESASRAVAHTGGGTAVACRARGQSGGTVGDVAVPTQDKA